VQIIELQSNSQAIAHDRDSLFSQLSESRTANDALSREISALKTERERQSETSGFFQSLSALIGEKVTSMPQIEKVLTDWRNSLSTITKLVHHKRVLKKQLAEVLTQNEGLEAGLDSQIQRNAALSQALETAAQNSETEKRALFQENEQLKTELETKNARNKELQTRLDQISQERERELTRLQQALDEKEKRIIELKTILGNPLRSETPQVYAVVHELASKTGECEEQRMALQDLEKKSDQLQKQLSAITEKNEKLGIRNAQLRQMIAVLQKSEIENRVALQAFAQETSDLKARIELCLGNIDSLKGHIRASSVFRARSKAQWQSKCSELDHYKKMLASFEEVIENQRMEIERFGAERAHLIELLERQNQTGVVLNEMLDNQRNQLKECEAHAAKIEKSNEELSLSRACESFLSRVRNRSQFNFGKILRDSQISNFIRIDKILTVIADCINQSEESEAAARREVETLTKSIAVEKGHAQRVLAVIATTIQTLAHDADQLFLETLGHVSMELETALKGDVFTSPDPLTSEFLIGGTLEARRQALQQMQTSGWDAPTTFALFNAQILANIAQRRTVENLTQTLAEQRSQIEFIQMALDCPDMNRAVEKVHEIVKILKNIRRRNKRLETIVAENNAERRSVAECERTIAEFKAQNESLRKDLQSLAADIATRQQELEVKTRQIQTLETSHQQLVDESSTRQAKHFEEICQLEKTIDELGRQSRDLAFTLEKLKAESNQKIESLTKQNQKLSETVRTKSIKFKQKVTALEEKRKQKLGDEQAIQGDFKTKFMTANEALHARDEECQRLSVKLSETLKANTQLSNQLSHLSVTNKSLEMQRRALNDQMEREAKIIASQTSLRAMTAETRFQQELNAVKACLKKEKNDLVTAVLSAFGQLQQFNGADIPDEAFLRVMRSTAQRLTSAEH
jgi:chromosome segregation ATPase